MFGDPDDIDVNKVEDTTIKGNLVTVRIECPSKPGFKTVTKKLPPTMQVGCWMDNATVNCIK